MGLNYDLSRYKKIAVGGGVISIVGGIFYEYYRFKKTFKSLINTDVLDIDKKRPDYIYIKYSIYQESMEEMRKQKNNKNWINVFIQPFGKWWKSIKHSVSWRLLEIAQTGDHHDRLKAVHQLARIDNLKDWDYQHLAQICDARTAISLARNDCDVRWFLPPGAPGAIRQPKSLIYEIRQQIDLLKPSKCINYFYDTTFNKFSILKGYNYDKSYQPNGVCQASKQEFQFIKQCLEVLFHLTKDIAAVRTIVSSGVLQTLMEIQKLFHNNMEMKFLLSKVMANISMCRESTYDFFVTGWVGILAHWSKNLDLRVQVTAAKALANMDLDDNNLFEYQPPVYPLHPRARVRQKPSVDIVFVHGLLGGVFVTWRQKDREEPLLGIYGKNSFYTKENDDIFLVGDIYVNGNIGNDYNEQTNKTNKKSDTILYEESPLIGKKSLKKATSIISDIATNELIATLQTANEVTPSWEVVFPDCPVLADANSKGPFSVSGEKWIYDDRNDEYTYCWPMDWLPNDCPNIRVIGLNYETSLSEWSSKNNNCPCEKKGTLHNRSEELLKSLTASGVGKECPVIWIGHSMGGLIVKSIIAQAMESNDKNTKQLAENTRGIIFLGTPHKGSAIAKLKQHIELIFSPTVEVKELEENSTYLLNLHDKFLKYMDEFKERIKVVSVVEGSPTVLTAFKFPLQIVTQDSAKLKFGDFYVLNVDHLGLSKPYFRQSFLYQRLLRVIKDVMNEPVDKIKKNGITLLPGNGIETKKS